MKIEIDLQSTWIRFQIKALQSVTYMLSLFIKHSIHEWLENTRRVRTIVISHRSNLENIMQQFPHTTTKMETIESYIRSPCWESKVQVIMSASKEETNTRRSGASSKITTIYIDESGINKRMRAVIYNLTMNRVTQQHLGNETQYNVFTAKTTTLTSAA